MLKKKSLISKFNKLLISRIELIESFFNRLKNILKLKKKKKINLKSINNRITIGVGSLTILILSYFLIPTLYDNDLIKTNLKNQIIEKYNLEVKFEKNLGYGLFPKPHFFVKNTTIIFNEKNIAKAEVTKIYISIKNFFSLKDIKIKDLFFRQTEFNIDSKDLLFFEGILNSNRSEHNLIFKNSILFFKNKDKDVVFFTEINNLNVFQNQDFNQQLNAKLNIFNIPFKLKIENQLKNKKLFANLNSHEIRLNIDNNFDYNDTNINGKLNFKIINKSKDFSYIIDENSLKLFTVNDSFKVDLDFKPFYLLSSLNFNQLDLKTIFNDNSILLNLLNSGILNNRNINAQLNINFNKIKGLKYLNSISLKTFFEEGNIILKDSTFNWNNSILINLNDTQLLNENGKLSFSGLITFDFYDIDSFYSQYQIKKIYRKKIKKISLNFFLNPSEKEVQLDNLLIDGNQNKKLNNFVNNFNSEKVNVFNKILFKNLVKNFFANF